MSSDSYSYYDRSEQKKSLFERIRGKLPLFFLLLAGAIAAFFFAPIEYQKEIFHQKNNLVRWVKNLYEQEQIVGRDLEFMGLSYQVRSLQPDQERRMRIEIIVLNHASLNLSEAKQLGFHLYQSHGTTYEQCYVVIFLQDPEKSVVAFATAIFSEGRLKSFVQQGTKSKSISTDK